ncbi:TlpA disulfide reductase family protein [Hymenobacter sp. BT770]|uniref:TlpA family protein disulfide reductase n=1 Tax=Hymenobacter sp. BT770 TaxID=2886942 RepID=UPI001D0F979E|nr:TlpA disulfide reductase family protein [Hymenobacter sp. BT770]MCC3154062.1 TlpA family protein disulfide reductase [Hymenobacter sp. BT770]MDO3416206.1 TlpA disulfide reductase family protein [Hymenobacter sp. BT770]
MMSSFVTCARRLLGTALLLAPVLSHGQSKPAPVAVPAQKKPVPVASPAPSKAVPATSVVPGKAAPAPAAVQGKPAPAAAAVPTKPAVAPVAPVPMGKAILTGRVSGPTTDTVSVSLRENPLDPKEKLIRTAVNEKGEFKLVVPVSGATKADLVYGDDVAPLFLDPGTDMDVRFKGNDMSSTLKFKANDVPTGFTTKLRNRSNLNDEQRHRQQAANANNYLVEADAQFVENDGFQVLPDNIQLYEAPFLSFLEYRRKHEFEFLEDHAAKQSFTQEFYNYARAEVVYAYANDRLTFQDLREQVVNTEGRLKMAPDYYNFLREPGLLNEPNAAQSELYHEFLLNYVHFAVAQEKHLRTDPDFYPASYALASKKLTGPTRAIILGRILQESFRFGHVKQSAAMLADFQTYDPKNQYYPTLQLDFDRHKDFAIGAPAPDFKLATANGDTVHLHDFAGKLVYLNFWKTTNGLCLRDLAYAQDLIRRFEGKNITFINIALDENEQAWRQLVTVKKLPGVQVRVPGGGLRSDVAQAYALQEVPTYMLVGEDGTFLNTKPKRLSSRAAIDEINQSFGKASTYTSAIDFPSTKK